MVKCLAQNTGYRHAEGRTETPVDGAHWSLGGFPSPQSRPMSYTRSSPHSTCPHQDEIRSAFSIFCSHQADCMVKKKHPSHVNFVGLLSQRTTHWGLQTEICCSQFQRLEVQDKWGVSKMGSSAGYEGECAPGLSQSSGGPRNPLPVAG